MADSIKTMARMLDSVSKQPKIYYLDRITAVMRKALKGSAVTLSEPRVDGFTLSRQLTAMVHDDRKKYRILIVPDNAKVTIDGRDSSYVFGEMEQ